MPDKSRGLFDKFRVTRLDGTHLPGGKHDGCEYFVLDWKHDSFTLPALEAYADACEKEGFDLLAMDLRDIVRRVRENA